MYIADPTMLATAPTVAILVNILDRLELYQ